MLGKFVVWVIKEIVAQAEAEWYSPESIRAELSQLQYRLQNNQITLEEYKEREKLLFNRLLEGRERGFE